MTEAANIGVKVSGNTTELVDSLKKAEKSVESFGQKSKKHLQNFSDIALAAGAAAVTAGAGIISGLAVAGSRAIDEQADLAQRLNTTSASIAVLGRASDLAGFSLDKVSTASTRLDISISKAAQGGNRQAEVFDRLGLSLEALARTPLDQRILTVNAAISESIPKLERAAIAAEIYGTKSAAAMLQLDPSVMSRASEEVKLLGLAISEVDAEKVGQANDTFKTFGMALDGIAQQVAIEVAPYISALSGYFLDAAKEAGGFGNVVRDVFEWIESAVRRVINVIDGVARTFDLVADGMIVSFAEVTAAIAASQAWLLEQLSKLPGVDFSEISTQFRALADEQKGIADEARLHIDETLARPMAGEVFAAKVEEARELSRASAQAAVDAKNEVELAAFEQQITDEEQRAIALQDMRNKAMAIGRASEESNAKIKADNEKRWAKAKRDETEKGLANLTTLMNTHSRKAFEVGKAAAISDTVISTISSAQKSYDALASIPYVGPVLGAAAAATAIAAGMARVSAIRRQSFGGGGGASAGSATENINSDSTPAARGGSGSGGGGGGQTLFVSPIDPDAVFSGAALAGSMKKVHDFTKDGGKVVFDA